MKIYNTFSMIIAILSLATSVCSLIITTKVKKAIEETKKEVFIRNRREELVVKLKKIPADKCTPENAKALIIIMEEINNEANFPQEERDKIAQSHSDLIKHYDSILSNPTLFRAQNDIAYIKAYCDVLSVLSALQM